MEYIAVLDQIFFAFQAHFSGFLGSRFAVAGDEVFGRDGFGADEAAFEIGVDDTGGLRGLQALGQGPGMGLFRADGEEGDQV